ncbi:hypothetical protein LX36DRAFT_740598 [Colletotrichum falcatum]|nr:hypothetical protein LX36DRAFT_740598 [Colletotrichum falcatum]
MERSARAAARPGLKEEQRASYLTQFRVIELERFLDDQTTAKNSTQDNVNFLESMVVRIQRLAKKSKITKADVQGLVKAHQLKIATGKKDLDLIAMNQRRASEQISEHTKSNPDIRVNITASTAFRSVVDDLDGIVHALKDSMTPPTLHARDNARLRSALASKEEEISLLRREIAELKVGSNGSFHSFVTSS